MDEARARDRAPRQIAAFSRLRKGRTPRISDGGTPLPNEGRISGRISDMSMTYPASRPVNPRFSSGPCAKPPTFSLDKLADAPLGRSHRAGDRQGEAEGRHRRHARDPRHSRGLPHRHRPGVRHRRGRDGDVDDAGRPPGRDAGLGKLRRRLGDRRGQAAQARRHRPQGRLWRDRRLARRSTSTRTWSSPGTARLRACASPTASGSRRTATG